MAIGGADIYGYGEVPDMLLTHSAMSPSYSCPPFGLAVGRESHAAFNTRDNKVEVSLCVITIETGTGLWWVVL